MLRFLVLIKVQLPIVSELFKRFLLFTDNVWIVYGNRFYRGRVDVGFLLAFAFSLGLISVLFLLFLFFGFIFLIISLLMFFMLLMVIFIVMMMLYIVLFLSFMYFFFFGLYFLFKFYFFKMLVLQFKFNSFIVLFEIILEKFQCLKQIMLSMISFKNINEFIFIGIWHRLIQYLKSRFYFRILSLIDLDSNPWLFKHKVQIHLLII